MVEKLVKIVEFENYIEAELAKQLLEDFGINSVVTGENTSNVYSGISAIKGPTLEVMESQAKEALEILESETKGEE